MARILVIDDDKSVCETLSLLVKASGHEALSCLRLKKGLELLSKDSWDLVFLDVHLPDGNGLKAIQTIKKVQGSPEVVIITGEGSEDGAEMSIKSGSWDYLQKPLAMEKMKLTLFRVLQYRAEKLIQKMPLVLNREGIVGNSPEIKQCLKLVAKAGEIDVNVLITGETGTGKELFARAIHENSRRNGHAFVVVDCATLPENLIESTLFGHEKGAFTGADRVRAGLIKEADGGTLFLDEVGELPLSQQRAFLRVLQERRFRPLGAKKDTTSDFRLIGATNRDIYEMVRAGTFREDLLFRLQSLSIELPPLRNRPGDIREIASHYTTKLSIKYGKGQKGYSPEFLEAITRYGWPGNVRELIHAIENAFLESREDPTLFPIHLPTNIRSQLARDSVGDNHIKIHDHNVGTEVSQPFPVLKQLMESTEKRYFQDLIQYTGGEIKEICHISGLSRSKVYTRFKKYGLSKSVSQL